MEELMRRVNNALDSFENGDITEDVIGKYIVVNDIDKVCMALHNLKGSVAEEMAEDAIDERA